MAAFQRVIVRRPGQADFMFSGRLLAEVCSPPPWRQSSRSRDLFDQPEWTCIRIYALADSQFVVVAEDYSDLRHVRRELRVCSGPDEVVDLLGHGELAKAACAGSGIDTCERPENDADEIHATPQIPERKPEEVKPPCAGESSGPTMTIVSRELLEKRLAVAKTSSYRRQLSALERLRDADVERSLAQASLEVVTKLIELEDRFPNLATALRFFRRQLSLCLLSRERILQIAPVLLTGPAGIGKTRLLQAVAASIGAEFHAISCGAMTANFVLSGADAQWAEAKPGKIFEALCGGKTGNPIILLDEIDKVSGERRYDPYGPLYTLLEPATARAFLDECLALEMNCAHISWVATANDSKALPEPILSRFKPIDVRMPKREEMRAIATSVYRDLLGTESWGQAFQPELSSQALEQLSALTPRQLRQVLVEAAGRVAERTAPDSVADGRQLEISPEDIEVVVPRTSARRVGFV